MMIDGEVYYTAQEVATYFDVSKNAVNQWSSRGDLKPRRRVKQGRYTISVFHEDDVKAYAQKRYGA